LYLFIREAATEELDENAEDDRLAVADNGVRISIAFSFASSTATSLISIASHVAVGSLDNSAIPIAPVPAPTSRIFGSEMSRKIFDERM
jgi:hypothetical protein